MSDSIMTLKEFMGAGGDEWTSGPQRNGIEAGSQFLAIKEKITREHRQLGWSPVSDLIVEKAGNLLEIDLKDILVGAWKKSEEVLECMNSEDTPPDETRTVALAEHVIRSNHSPRLEVLLNGKPIGEILFHLQLALKLEGFLLIIQGGRIREIRSGVCQGSGLFKCEDIVLLEKKTGPVRLPGTLTLDP